MSEADSEIQTLRDQVGQLRAERDCATTLAWYGFHLDHNRLAEWVSLFTDDAAMDVLMYYGDDIMDPDPEQWRQTRIVGHENLLALVSSETTASIVGRSQHQMGGPPAAFRLTSPDMAVMVTYSVVYVKDLTDPAPIVQYQNHAMNRWSFRREDGRWLITENIRRSMGHPDSALLFRDI